MPDKKPIRVALVYDDSLDGSEGVTQQVKILGAWLSGRGHEVSYLVGQTKTSSWRGGKVFSLSKNVKVIFNGNRMSVPLPAKRSAINRALDEAKPDILHVQMPHSPFMAQKVINRAKLPVLGTFHIYPADFIARAGSRLLKLIYFGGLNRINEVVSVSPAAQQFAAQAFKIKSDVVPNMVELSRYKSAKTQNQPNKIVFLGRLVKRKGCRDLIEAFTVVAREVPGSSLVIGGDGPQRQELEKLVQDRRLADRVSFLGFVPEDDKPDLLAGADIACFPSLYGESFGIVLTEAMAAGAGAVLGADNPGYAGVLSDVPEVLFEAGNPEALAIKLVHLLRHRDEIDAIHKKQAALVGRYDVESVGLEIEKRYLKLIAKSS